MTYLAYDNAMLERFRAKHRELLAAHAAVNLYAVVDPVMLQWYDSPDTGQWLEPLQRMSLYAGSGLDSVEATGPVLLTMPDLRGTGKMTASSFSVHAPTAVDVFVKLLVMSMRNSDHVTWIWSPHALGPLVEHLQTLLHARLEPDGEDAWFFFYQPSHLKVLHERLPDATRRNMFGPIHAWWTLDSRGDLVELAGESGPLPPAWDAFPIPADVVTALQRAAMPVQVHAWLQKSRMNLSTFPFRNGQVAEIEPLVNRALDHGFGSKADVATFVAYGLRYKVDYDRHPQIQALLNATVTEGRPLAVAYRDVSADVWDELMETAQQRIDAEKARAWHSALRKAGQIRIRTRTINTTGSPISGVFFDLPGIRDAQRQYVGNPYGIEYCATAGEKDALVSPLPGGKVMLSWYERSTYAPGRHMQTPREREIVVTGELPLNDKSGWLEIRFGLSGQSIVMHADGGPDDQTKGKQQ